MSSASGAGGGGGLLVAILLVVVIGPTHAPTSAKSSQSDVFLEVKPDTVAPGQHVELRAGCDDDRRRATASSRAFGEVTLVARAGGGKLTGSVTVPAETRPGDYRVTLHCHDGATARAKLVVIDKSRPPRGPDTGGGGTAADDQGAGGAAADTTGDQRAGGGTALLAGVGIAALLTGSLLLARRRRGS